MEKRIKAVKAALEKCVIPEHREVILIACWRNGFFGDDPFGWAELAELIGASVSEIEHARWKVVR